MAGTLSLIPQSGLSQIGDSHLIIDAEYLTGGGRSGSARVNLRQNGADMIVVEAGTTGGDALQFDIYDGTNTSLPIALLTYLRCTGLFILGSPNVKLEFGEDTLADKLSSVTRNSASVSGQSIAAGATVSVSIQVNCVPANGDVVFATYDKALPAGLVVSVLDNGNTTANKAVIGITNVTGAAITLPAGTLWAECIKH